MSKCPRCGQEEDLWKILVVERENRSLLEEILKLVRSGSPVLPISISFEESSMLPVAPGNTLVYTGTLSPSGATFPADTFFKVSSNDPAVVPTVDGTGLVVTVPLPTGWVEETPLAVSYSATSASNPDWTLAGSVTPGPEAILPTGILFAQTT